MRTPSWVRSMEIERDYHRLNKGPGKGDLEDWIDDWEITYNKMDKSGFFENNNDRPVRDFLLAITNANPVFSMIKLIAMVETPDTLNVLNIIKTFRDITRLYKIFDSSHSASGDDDTNPNPDKPDKPSFRGRGQSQRPLPRCICGVQEFYINCPYLNTDKRSSTWKPDPEIKKKVETAMKDPDIKDKVEQGIENSRKYLNRKNDKAKAKEEKSQAESSTTFSFTTLSVIESSFLKSSWILSHGSTTHVCNKTMKHRFIKDEDGNGKTIIAGNQALQIEAFGHMDVYFDTDEGVKTMTLLNVSYIENFMTNFVSGIILHKKGVDFDTEYSRLHKNGETMGYAHFRHDHFLIEDNVEGENHGHAGI